MVRPQDDYLEVIFDRRTGYFRETADDRIMEKVAKDGNVLGFSILQVITVKGKPMEIVLH